MPPAGNDFFNLCVELYNVDFLSGILGFYIGGHGKIVVVALDFLIACQMIDCIIQLPSNLFFGTSIATCIMVLKKGKADNKTLFIDATGECIKVTNNNKLTSANIDRIVDTFAARAEEAHFSHLASYEEIESNDYNLSVICAQKDEFPVFFPAVFQNTFLSEPFRRFLAVPHP